LKLSNEAEATKAKLNKWGKEKTAFVFLIDFECKKPLCWRLDENTTVFKYDFNGFTNIKKVPKNSKALQFERHPESFEIYKERFEKVKRQIEYGNSFLVNLTTETPIETNFSLGEIFESVKAKYSCWLQNEFVCFSPETFIKISNQKIYSYPMKGTINAQLPNAEETILNDAKELAEHATIVDLIRNDLSKVAANVKVDKFRFYEKIETQNGMLGQVSSEISGNLHANYTNHIGDILFDLLPAGSICGAPKAETEKIIFDAEQVARGYYTGIAGYFDGENLDSCVLIRYLQQNNIYRSGGGITFQSEATKEYQEMIEKVYVPIF
jgi:para-aminobenzoate synthetase component 1